MTRTLEVHNRKVGIGESLMGREKTDRRESRKLHDPAGLANGFGNAYPL